jgi:hypothetical protein
MVSVFKLADQKAQTHIRSVSVAANCGIWRDGRTAAKTEAAAHQCGLTEASTSPAFNAVALKLPGKTMRLM